MKSQPFDHYNNVLSLKYDYPKSNEINVTRKIELSSMG